MSRTRKSAITSLLKRKPSTTKSSPVAAIRNATKSQWTDQVHTDAYRQFGLRYFDRPDLFAEECIRWEEGQGPTDYQKEILRNVVIKQRISARGPHGLGKSGMAAWIVLWFALTRDALEMDWKIPTTASAWRQLSKFLWPEIHKWTKRVKWTKVGRKEFNKTDELLSLSLKLEHGEAFALASNRGDLIEGAHADHIMYVFDESKAIPDATWNSAEGALVNAENAYWFSISTPGEPAGRFYDIQCQQEGYEDWWVRHVSLQEAVDAGRIGKEWAEQRRKQWGEHSAEYQNKVRGEFAQQEEDSLIPLHWIEQSMQMWYDRQDMRNQEMDQIGVDVARMGGDKTVFAMRHGNWIDELEKYGSMDTTRATGIATPKMRDNMGTTIMVDVIGWGAGLFDNLAERFNGGQIYQTDRVFPFHTQEKTDVMDKKEVWEMNDCYSGAYWNIREMLDPDNGDDRLILPPDTELKQELVKFKWSVNSRGKIYVIRKEKVKEELGRSPDSADAVSMACWLPVEYGMEAA